MFLFTSLVGPTFRHYFTFCKTPPVTFKHLCVWSENSKKKEAPLPKNQTETIDHINHQVTKGDGRSITENRRGETRGTMYTMFIRTMPAAQNQTNESVARVLLYCWLAGWLGFGALPMNDCGCGSMHMYSGSPSLPNSHSGEEGGGPLAMY